MFKTEAKCTLCSKKIQPYEEVYIKIRYPKTRGFTEIKAFLNNEGQFICEDCFYKSSHNPSTNKYR